MILKDGIVMNGCLVLLLGVPIVNRLISANYTVQHYYLHGVKFGFEGFGNLRTLDLLCSSQHALISYTG